MPSTLHDGSSDGSRTSLVSLLGLALCIALGVAPLAQAADATPSTPAKPPAKTTAKAAAQAKADKAKGMALAVETVQRISEAQLLLSDRVLTGEAACEFNQTVNVERVDGKPGHFRLSYKKAVYTVIPEETTSGALRLEDKKAGIVWLQIPSKSMLMNARIGQRMVDGCMHPEQRAAVSASEAAASVPERRP